MYGYENYHKIKSDIEKRRISAVAAADARNEELRAQNEEIRQIDKELVSTGLRLFKAACAGEDVAPIRERNLALTARRREIILSLGYPEDYTEVKYTCPRCSDSGFEDGRMCTCFREALVAENIKSSGIGKQFDYQSFENFELEGYGEDKEIMGLVLAQAKRYAESFDKDAGNLLLLGSTGTGKTHLSTAIAKTVIGLGYEVIYDTIQNVISAFEQDKFKSGYAQTESKAQKYLECDLLIIDDLGTEFINQFTVSCLYNLLNTRINNRLPMVISTNVPAERLREIYDDRIFSRIFGASRLLLLNAKDRRLG